VAGRRQTDATFIAALACGASVEQAARKAAISERTAYRRLADPAVQQRVAQARADTAQRLSGMLTAAGLEGVKTLVTLQDAAYPAAVRLRAAEATVELGLKLREESSLGQRFDQLEQALRTEGAAAKAGKSHEHPHVVEQAAPAGGPLGAPAGGAAPPAAEPTPPGPEPDAAGGWAVP